MGDIATRGRGLSTANFYIKAIAKAIVKNTSVTCTVVFPGAIYPRYCCPDRWTIRTKPDIAEIDNVLSVKRRGYDCYALRILHVQRHPACQEKDDNSQFTHRIARLL